MAESCAPSGAAPFNPRNRLLTAADVHAFLARYGVHDSVQDCSEFVKSMVHRSYSLRKNESFLSANQQCPQNCLPLQQESNERLEFLGDAVLNIIVADYLFERFPSENEGFLTRMRSKIVNGHMLSELSLMLGLDRYVVVSRQIEENDGRKSRKVLEDCFEAFIGAMYLTLKSFEKTSAWFVAFLEQNVDIPVLVLTQNNFKDVLAKFFQSNFNCQPKFVEVADAGTPQVLGAKCSVMVKNEKSVVVGIGHGPSRKLAEEEAARAALKYYGVSLYDV